MEREGSQNWFRGELLWINSRKRAVLDCLCAWVSLALFVNLYFVVRVSHRAKREFEKEINKNESMVGLSLFVCEIDTKSSCNLSLSGGGKWGTWDVLFSFRNYGIGMHFCSHTEKYSRWVTQYPTLFSIYVSQPKKKKKNSYLYRIYPVKSALLCCS